MRAADVEVATTVFPKYYHTTTRRLNPADLTVRKTTFRRPVVKLAPLMSTRSRAPMDEDSLPPGGGCSGPAFQNQRQPSA